MDGEGVSSVVDGRNCRSDTISVGEIADHLSLPGDAVADHRPEEFRDRELATEATNPRGEQGEELSERRQEELQQQQPHQQTQQPHQQTQQRQRNEQQSGQKHQKHRQQQQQQQGRRAFCVECHKATSVCICDRFGEPVDNRVGVTILQHPKEKYHPLGSARIALLGLQRVRVVVVPLGPGRPGLQPKDPCSRRSLLGRSGRGRWRKGAGKAQGQGGKQGEGAGEEQGQGQGNGQGHGQGPELGADQGKGEGHGQEQGQGQGKGLGETQGNAEGRMLQEGEEAPQQRLWGDQAQRTGESSERGNARDGEASTGIDGGLVVVTAVGEKVEVRGGKLHEVEEREGEVREGEECVENGVEQEGSRGVGANGPVLGEQQGGETANGASTGDSSFDLSFDLLPFAAADGAESDDGRGDHHADGSSAVDGGGMWCEDNIEYGTKGLASTACGDGCSDDSSCSCSKGGRRSSVRSKSTKSKSRRSSSSSWRVVPEEFAADNHGLRMSHLHNSHSTASSTPSSIHSSSHSSSSSCCPSNQMRHIHLEDRALSTSTASSSTSSRSCGSKEAVSTEPVEIPEWISLPPGAAVLYPSPRSIELQPPQQSNGAERSAPSIGDQSSDVLRPSHLIVLDGTWPKAKRILCQNPWLLQLPHYHLPPQAAAPSRYGFIRKQPKLGCLSTIEAVVYALQILEPDNRVKLDELLEVFNSMVIDQVEGMRRNGKSSLIPDDWIAPGTLAAKV